MRKSEMEKFSPNELVDEFLRVSLAQYEAIENDEIVKYNKLFSRTQKVEDMLKSMPGDQLRLLLALYAHENIFVRLQSAFATQEIAPSAARRAFEQIAATRIYPYAADADGALEDMDDENSSAE